MGFGLREIRAWFINDLAQESAQRLPHFLVTPVGFQDNFSFEDSNKASPSAKKSGVFVFKWHLNSVIQKAKSLLVWMATAQRTRRRQEPDRRRGLDCVEDDTAQTARGCI